MQICFQCVKNGLLIKFHPADGNTNFQVIIQHLNDSSQVRLNNFVLLFSMNRSQIKKFSMV
jgi:hypothetical protein